MVARQGLGQPRSLEAHHDLHRGLATEKSPPSTSIGDHRCQRRVDVESFMAQQV